MSLKERNTKLLNQEELEKVDSDGSWAVSYGDMITLLLSFFVIYFTADFDAKQKATLQDSLVETLQEMNKSLKNMNEKHGGLSDDDILNSMGKIEGLDKKLSGLSGKEGGNLEAVNKDKAGTLEDVGRALEKLEAKIGGISNLKALDAEALKPFENYDAKFHIVGSGIMIEFPGLSFFDLGKVNLKELGEEKLESFAKYFIPFSGKYVLNVRAFTDKNPVVRNRHRYQDNLELSALRSIASMRVLQRSGIPLSRMQLAGLGENDLIYSKLEEIYANMTIKERDAVARTVVLLIMPENRDQR